ncbi:MAG: UbiA family prenyltransferase [Gemmatimonadales bacterium]
MVSRWRRRLVVLSAWPAALVLTARPLSSLVVGTLTASAAVGGLGRLTTRSINAGLAMTVLAMFGFVVNDIFDYDKDRVAGVRRPIADGTLSRRSAALWAAGLLATAMLLATTVGSGGIVLAITAAALLLYSPLALRLPLGKDVCVAGICCAPLLYGATVVGVPRSWISYVTLACFVFGRELLMDSDEQPGDSRAGVRTIAAILGCRWTTHIGAALMLLSAVALVAIVRGPLVTAAAAATLLLLAYVFTWPGIDSGARIRLSRLPMLLGSVALACGA